MQFIVCCDKFQPGNCLLEPGEAVAVEVGPEASTLRVTLSRDAFISGDYVALRKWLARLAGARDADVAYSRVQ